tara:strand:+ start:690 stop:1355 length:666 start_codon:yes stop_codon:yes gene_type:complete
MTIKLNGSTAGSVSLDAPASTTGNADIALTLPVADGSNGQFLQTNGSGALTFATPSDTKWVYGTAADYDQWTSTTDAAFSGWPSSWQHIRISFDSVSSAGNTDFQFYLSKSSDPSNKIETGYHTSSAYTGPGQAGNNAQNQGRFNGIANNGYYIIGELNFYKFSGNLVRYNGSCCIKDDSYVFFVEGNMTCDPTTAMTHIFLRNQGYSWDAGKFKLDYLAG